ncbi:MAG: Fe-S cluster protein, partial [Candidatus Hydrogenedentota bacterium]
LPAAVTVTATIEFEDDLTELLPYLNAVLGPCVYEPDVPFLRLNRKDKPIAVYPRKIAIAGLRDQDEANEVFAWVRESINSIAARIQEIEPSYWSLSEIKPLDIFKLLPRTNCGECVQSTCMAFAAALANGEGNPDDCPGLLEARFAENRSRLLKLFRRPT